MNCIKDNTLKEEFKSLVKDIWQIDLKWKTYKQLYGNSQKEVDILNQTAPLTFKVFHNALYDSILLSIQRIMDSKTIGSYRNLSIDRILEVIKEKGKENLYNELKNSYDQIEEKAETTIIKDHRDKRIGHNDLETKKDNYENLKGISRNEIDEILEDIYDLMNKINEEFYEGKIGFGNMPIADGNLLIEKLKDY